MTNSTKSAFFIAKLKPAFFSRYKPLGETNVEKRRGVRCQLYAKVRAAPIAMEDAGVPGRRSGSLKSGTLADG